MRHQHASTVVALPLETVERRLRDVESWPAFLHGVGSIRCTGHERYLFRLNDGRDHREIKMVVKLRYRDHCFVWRPVTGPTIHGSLHLRRVDDRHTRITLEMATLPPDLWSGMAELLMPSTSIAALDLRRLEKHLTGAVTG